MATLKSTSRVAPTYVYPNSWGVGDLLILCESIHKQIGISPESTPVEQYIVDWDVVVATVKSVLPHRGNETNVSCYQQYQTLSTNILRSGNYVYVDALSGVQKCLSVLREGRIRELQFSILQCDEKAKIYQADYDFHAGKSQDPSMMQAPVMLPFTHPDAPVAYASAGAVGSIPCPITGSGNAPSVLFHIVPAERSKAQTYSFINNYNIIKTNEEVEKLKVGDCIQVSIPTCVAPVDVFLEPRVYNQSVLKCIIEDVYTSIRAGPFLHPVKAHEAPRYLDIISKPMDLGTVRTMVHAGQVPHAFMLYELISLVYTNAYTYNAKNAEIWLMARDLDFHTSAIFQCCYPRYSELFIPSVIDAKKGVRKLKKTHIDSNTIMPISKHPELLVTLQQHNISPGSIQTPTPVVVVHHNTDIPSNNTNTNTTKQESNIPSNTSVIKEELVLQNSDSHSSSSSTSSTMLPSSSKKKKRSPSPQNETSIPQMPSIMIPDAVPASSSMKTPNRRSKTPRPDEVDADSSVMTPASKRQRSSK